MRKILIPASVYLATLCVWLCAALPGRAQSTLDLRINELLVYNDSNFVDSYGQHSPWFEIFNTAYNTVNMGGLFLTNDLSNPRMYRIPKGQAITAIAPRNFLVFYANNNPTNGVLHVNFDLRNSEYIALFEANGKTLIDSVHIRKHATSDLSQGRVVDGIGGWKTFELPTPGTSNETEVLIAAADKFGNIDPAGSGMTFISMGIVFSALILLTIVFTMIGKFMTGGFFKKKITQVAEGKHIAANGEISGEINAAILMALHLYKDEQQRDKSAVLTIHRMSKLYSPWSSKIYSMRQMPR